jgi:hypothetical protein
LAGDRLLALNAVFLVADVDGPVDANPALTEAFVGFQQDPGCDAVFTGCVAAGSVGTSATPASRVDNVDSATSGEAADQESRTAYSDPNADRARPGVGQMHHQNVTSAIYAGLKGWSELLKPLDLPLDGFRYPLAFGGCGCFLREAHESLCAHRSMAAAACSNLCGQQPEWISK